MKNILIYKDQGVSPKSYQKTLRMCRRFAKYNEENNKDKIHIIIVTADMINNEPWEETANCLIIPGGRETPYSEDLYPNGFEKIKNFVLSGGYYLGLCAGGYFGASRIVFERGHPEHEVITDRPLGLYKGIAEGPAYGLGVFKYFSEEGARIAQIKTIFSDASKFSTYFNGGCWFHSHSEDDNINIIARYEDIKNQPAAIISFNYGKGRVCLSGVHFEYQLKDEEQNARDAFIRLLEIF
jgi:glutamine amidotransferase-like uncharacterized protein